MTAAVETKPVDALAVTTDQLDLIRRTVAQGATSDELKLYLFDCHRQGVHPLDKLIHFTKRGGRYTPITSIDFMRTRAADTNEYAGSDDAAFDADEEYPADGNLPTSARVTVWRFVQGQKCSFTATARWAEYCPPTGQDHMWKKMPRTMLAKCAEALALRKGFPRQLAGLYAKEEMEQANEPQPAAAAVIDNTLMPPDQDGYAQTVSQREQEDAIPAETHAERVARIKRDAKARIANIVAATDSPF